MANSKSFNAVVAARTLAAKRIAETPELLEKWVALGGLRSDLEAIVQHGREAESLNQQQSEVQRTSEAMTMRLQDAFAALDAEHDAIMAVVSVMSAHFVEQKPVYKRLHDIMANGGSLRRRVEGKRRRRSTSYEAVRAEIARDARALLTFTDVAAPLAQRHVTRERLEQLVHAAETLPDTAGDRLLSKSERKALTAREWNAVAAQRLVWGSVYGLFRRLAGSDVRVADLLKPTVR